MHQTVRQLRTHLAFLMLFPAGCARLSESRQGMEPRPEIAPPWRVMYPQQECWWVSETNMIGMLHAEGASLTFSLMAPELDSAKPVMGDWNGPLSPADQEVDWEIAEELQAELWVAIPETAASGSWLRIPSESVDLALAETLMVIFRLPWSDSRLREGWIQVTYAGQEWWYEVPYGLTAASAPCSDQDSQSQSDDGPNAPFPKDLCRSVGAIHQVVPWEEVVFDVDRSPVREVSLRVEGGTAKCGLRLWFPTSVEDLRERLRPEISVSAPEIGLRGYLRKVELDAFDSDVRLDTFEFNFGPACSRDFATLVVTGGRHAIRLAVPTSLLLPEHAHFCGAF